MTFPQTATFFALLCATLFGCLLLYPNLIYLIFALDPHPLGDFLARRAATLFAGIAVISYFARSAAPSPTRTAICLGIATAMFGLAATGLFEFLRGYVGLGIWLAVLTEITFGILFLRHR